MLVLGIETSCDETAVAVVEGGRCVLSNVVSSSIRFHKRYGGVIPEIASRLQLELIDSVLDNALSEAKVELKDINAIAVTSGPGLNGSLLVGVCFAKAVAFALGVALVEINHLYAHLFAAFLNSPLQKRTFKKIEFPFVGLVVSGGHTSLFWVKDFDRIELLGSTLDDACGEAFDKVAKILGLGYPGGPLIEKLAQKGNAQKIKFGRILSKKPLDFSFSGIKTAVLYIANDKYRQIQKQDLAASFQEAVFNNLTEKASFACRMKGVDRLVIGGGVAANNRMRKKFYQQAKEHRLEIFFSPLEFCTDNAAMVAGLGHSLFRKRKVSGWELTAKTN